MSIPATDDVMHCVWNIVRSDIRVVPNCKLSCFRITCTAHLLICSTHTSSWIVSMWLAASSWDWAMQRRMPWGRAEVRIRVTCQTFLLRRALHCTNCLQTLTTLIWKTWQLTCLGWVLRWGPPWKCSGFHSSSGMWCCVVCSILKEWIYLSARIKEGTPSRHRPGDTASCPRTPESSATPLWKP